MTKHTLLIVPLLLLVSQAFGGSSNAGENNFPSLLFPPYIKGTWFSPNADLTDTVETILKSDTGKNIKIQSIRLKRIPFLTYDRQSAILFEATPPNTHDAYYIIVVLEEGKEGGVLVLDGKGDSITKFNKKIGFSITSASTAQAYLSFFTSSIASSDGIFIVADPSDKFFPKDILDPSEIKPIVATENTDGSFTISASVVAGNSLFESTFNVTPTGEVDMVSVKHVRDLGLNHKVVMNGKRRTFVTIGSPPEKKTNDSAEAKIHRIIEDLVKAGQFRNLQLALQKLGYDPGPIDGVFGSKTQTALDRYYADRPHLTRATVAPERRSGAPTEKQMHQAVVRALKLKTGSKTKGDLITYRALFVVIAFRIADFEKISCYKLRVPGYQCDYSMKIQFIENQGGMGPLMEQMLGGMGDIISARFVRARSGWRAILPK